MFQGGDPSGTGRLDPSDTIYGKLFKDEFHSRLKFKHRGMVGCANDNRPDSNGSMFFVTLDRAEHLNKQATIFGRVCGDTVHNLSRFNEVDTDQDDRPEFPIEITEATVLIPPFDDIVPRAGRGKGEVVEAVKVAKSKVKNAALMSFDDEDFEDEGFAVKKKGEGERKKTEEGGKAKAGERKGEPEVLLDYGEEAEEQPREQPREQPHEQPHEKPREPEPSCVPAHEDKADEQQKAAKKKGPSLVQVAREQYVSKQKKYSSKRKKESDVLARIKQFKASGVVTAKTALLAAEETETTETTENGSKSVLRQLDDLLHS